jgi:hypothetical protein
MEMRLPAIIALVPMLAGCNGHLSRSRAKSQLEEAARQVRDPDGPHPLLVRVGTICGVSDYYDPVQSRSEYIVLSAAGYLTIRPVRLRGRKSVWDVELTESGRKTIGGEKYGHEQNGDCDEWQVTIPTAKYDHLDVTGIVEEGVHARVEAAQIFVITPAGMAVRKFASKIYGNRMKLGNEFLSDDHERLTNLLGEELAYAPPSADRYVIRGSFTFEKYDDGWKPVKAAEGK